MLRHLSLVVLIGTTPVPLLAEKPAAKPAASDRDDPDKVICRRESITGSLSQTRKVCMTRAQWVERTRNAQAFGQEMQERGLINPCGATTPGAC